MGGWCLWDLLPLVFFWSDDNFLVLITCTFLSNPAFLVAQNTAALFTGQIQGGSRRTTFFVYLLFFFLVPGGTAVGAGTRTLIFLVVSVAFNS